MAVLLAHAGAKRSEDVGAGLLLGDLPRQHAGVRRTDRTGPTRQARVRQSWETSWPRPPSSPLVTALTRTLGILGEPLILLSFFFCTFWGELLNSVLQPFRYLLISAVAIVLTPLWWCGSCTVSHMYFRRAI